MSFPTFYIQEVTKVKIKSGGDNPYIYVWERYVPIWAHWSSKAKLPTFAMIAMFMIRAHMGTPDHKEFRFIDFGLGNIGW